MDKKDVRTLAVIICGLVVLWVVLVIANTTGQGVTTNTGFVEDSTKSMSAGLSSNDMFASSDDLELETRTNEVQVDVVTNSFAYYVTKPHVVKTEDAYYFVTPKNWEQTAFLSSKIEDKDVVLCEGYNPMLNLGTISKFADYIEVLPSSGTAPEGEYVVHVDDNIRRAIALDNDFFMLDQTQLLVTNAETGEPISSEPAEPWAGPVD